MNKFKKGEIIEQIKNVDISESPFCEIVDIESVGISKEVIWHKHLNKKIVNNAPMDYFKHIPKLKKLLLV